MSFPTIFANLAAGVQPASLLDTMFNLCGGMGNIPTTAIGTNTLTLTPVTNFYQPAAYANYQMVTWTQPATTTGNVTAQLGALAFINVYMPSGLQAGSGDLLINQQVTAVFAQALNAGAGGWRVINATTPSVVQPTQGAFKNLLITNGATPDSQVAVTADEIMLENASGGAAKVGGAGAGVSFTISTGVAGVVNGLDTGTIAQNTFYSVWCITNGSTVGGLLSLSATTPTLPAGYTFKARLGWVRTGAASTNLHRTRQMGRRTSYVVTAGSQTVSLPTIPGLGVGAGNVTPTVQGASGANAFVPPSASVIWLVLTLVCAANNVSLSVAPTAYAAGSFPLNCTGNATATPALGGGAILLETTTINIQWPVNSTATVSVYGWEDNL